MFSSCIILKNSEKFIIINNELNIWKIFMELINLGESSHMCAALIMYDGWQIAKDYPW